MNNKLHINVSKQYWTSWVKVLCYLQSEKIWVMLHKINTCLQKTITCIGLQAEQIFSVNI